MDHVHVTCLTCDLMSLKCSIVYRVILEDKVFHIGDQRLLYQLPSCHNYVENFTVVAWRKRRQNQDLDNCLLKHQMR